MGDEKRWLGLFCTLCGDQLPATTSAAHTCVGRVTFNPTGAGVTATVPQFVINPPPTDWAANAEKMARLERDLQSANERIEALTKERDEAKKMAGTFMRENDHVYEQLDKYVDTSDTLGEKLLALQGAAREYMEHVDAEMIHDDPRRLSNHERACPQRQSLVDLLKS